MKNPPFAANTKPLELEVRQRLFTLVSESPGVHFRDIQRRTKMATGTLSYHLDQLVKVGLLKTMRDGEYLRYYAQSDITEEEKKVLDLMRRPSVRHIVLSLIQHEELSNEQLSEILRLSPSTVAWHLKKIVEANLVNTRQENRKVLYSLGNPELVKKVLIRYKESFVDRLVDKFVDMWET